MNQQTLRILIVNDSEEDALLLINELRRGGFIPGYERVETAEDTKAALRKESWDIIFSDSALHCFNPLAVLDILKEIGVVTPFIIVAEEEGEEIAVEGMRAGAHDYLIKDNLTRLVPAVERELREAEARKERKCKEDDRRQSAEEEKVTLEQQLLQSQKMEAIGRLAGGIAHDFNNLLTIVKGYCQLSMLDLQDGDPLKKNIGEIQKASDKAATLVRQLLSFSRRQVMEMMVIDLNGLIRDLDMMLRRVIGEDIELVALLSEDLGRVKGDPGHIEQVIMNLAVNARDAMPKGGKLIIETTNLELGEKYSHSHFGILPGFYIMFSMSDSGVGMSSEVRERIFEPFFTTKEKGKGTGLGLSTAYGIVRQMGGHIWVYSEPGHGTTFKIYFPRIDEPLERVKPKGQQEELPSGKETVLVVEDEKEVRALASSVLRRQGYRVLEASNGGIAILLCEQHRTPIHLILTDVVMPEMNGQELATRLAGLHPEMKVLFMSGYTDDAIVHHGILKKGVHFIQKPFAVENLVRKVRDVLDH